MYEDKTPIHIKIINIKNFQKKKKKKVKNNGGRHPASTSGLYIQTLPSACMPEHTHAQAHKHKIKIFMRHVLSLGNTVANREKNDCTLPRIWAQSRWFNKHLTMDKTRLQWSHLRQPPTGICMPKRALNRICCHRK